MSRRKNIILRILSALFGLFLGRLVCGLRKKYLQKKKTKLEIEKKELEKEVKENERKFEIKMGNL